MEVNKERIATITKAGLALQSPTVIQACISTIERELKAFNAPVPTNWSSKAEKLKFSLLEGLGYIYVSISSSSDDMYNTIMSSKHTNIGSTKTISCKYTIEQVLVDYGINLKINFDFSCPLPYEDLQTLRMLGKVHTEHSSYSHTSESIVCEI